jgi:chromosome segregation ATPase
MASAPKPEVTAPAPSAPASSAAPTGDAELLALKASMFDEAETKQKAAEKRAAAAEEAVAVANGKLADAHRRGNELSKRALDAEKAVEALEQGRHDELTQASQEIAVLRNKVEGLKATVTRLEGELSSAATRGSVRGGGRVIALTNIRHSGERIAKGAEIPEHIAAVLTEGVHYAKQ